MDPKADGIGRGKRLMFMLILLFGIPLAGFLLIEGGSSLVVLVIDMFRVEGQALHGAGFNRYDTLVGWVSQPGVKLQDYYGPGLHLHTNAQGFRGLRDLPSVSDSGRVRVVCSGDSFTFGVGVGDDDTWCQRLEARESLLETANLGQAGYGFDQIYLRYKRDGASLDPAIHVFGFIWDDVYRMQLTVQWGYGKPILTLVNGQLETGNVPVPEGAHASPRLTALLGGMRGALRGLRAIELTRRIRVWLAPAGAEWTERGLVSGAADSATWRVAEAALEDLGREAERGGAVLAIVHFPSGDDARYQNTPWRELARETARAKKLHYLDLAERLAALPPERREGMYIPNDPHFTPAGQDWAAGEILEFIRETPALAARLPKSGRAAADSRSTTPRE